jgi:hypothetical protein
MKKYYEIYCVSKIPHTIGAINLTGLAMSGLKEKKYNILYGV